LFCWFDAVWPSTSTNLADEAYQQYGVTGHFLTPTVSVGEMEQQWDRNIQHASRV